MVLERQDIPKALVVVHLSDRAPIPRSTEIEAGAVFAPTRTSRRVTRRTLQSMGIRENVEPYGDPNALA